MKARQDLEKALAQASKTRLDRLKLVHETLHSWCDHRLFGNGDHLKSAILLGAYSDACHHFAQSHFDERQALFELHAYTAV